MKLLSLVRLFATPWTVAHQAPPSMEFSRQEYCSGLPFPSAGDLHEPGIKPGSPALPGRFFTTEPPGKPRVRNAWTMWIPGSGVEFRIGLGEGCRWPGKDRILKPNHVSPVSNHSWEHLAERPAPSYFPFFRLPPGNGTPMPPPMSVGCWVGPTKCHPPRG